jgi:hypothetical protein
MKSFLAGGGFGHCILIPNKVRHLQGFITLGVVRMRRRVLQRNIIRARTTVADHATALKCRELRTEGVQRRSFFALFDGIDQGFHTWFAHVEAIKPFPGGRKWNRSFRTPENETIRAKCKTRAVGQYNEDSLIIPIRHQHDRILTLCRQNEPRRSCSVQFNQKVCRAPSGHFTQRGAKTDFSSI